MSQAKLIGIALRSKSHAPMIEVDKTQITTEEGVLGDFRGKPGRRQVTVLSADDWEAACAALGRSLPWTTRRANLLVEGLTFFETKGAVLNVGDVVLKVTGETDPCERMEQASAGLLEALTPHWRGGVCCRVISGGWIERGDAVSMQSR